MTGSYSGELAALFAGEPVLVSSIALTCFRVGFGFSLLVKYLVECSRGYPAHVAPGTLLYETQHGRTRVGRMSRSVYASTFHLRPFAAALLLAGVEPRACAALLCLSYWSELLCLFRYHAIVAAIVCGLAALDPATRESATVLSLVAHSGMTRTEIDAPSVVFMKTLVVTMYFSSTLRKTQHGFATGAALYHGVRFSLLAAGRRFPDHAISLTKSLLAHVSPKTAQRMAVTTMAGQVFVGALLLCSPPFSQLGCVIGVALHIGFTVLFPTTLSFFTVMMVSLYSLWFFT